jgi:nitrogen fixation NifU-like protein
VNDLRELYQEVILDHRKQPRNFREMEEANRRLEGYNPLCGDRVTVYLQVKDDVVQDVSFQGMGCAISTASASMMTEFLKGKKVEEAEVIFQHFQDLVTGKSDGSDRVGKLVVFGGVSEFPLRVKCATLPWHTLRAALKQQAEAVTTE